MSSNVGVVQNSRKGSERYVLISTFPILLERSQSGCIFPGRTTYGVELR